MKNSWAVLIFLLFCVLSFLPLTVGRGNSPDGHSFGNGASAASVLETTGTINHDNFNLPSKQFPVPSQYSLPMPAVSAQPAQQTLNATSGFEGIRGQFLGAVPPDVQLAASSKHIMEMVNLNIEIYNKQGGSVSSPSMSSFFSTGFFDTISDPKVLFDLQSNRWFASITDLSDSSVHVAVSNSEDPTGSWHHYTFAASSGDCADQPIIGLSDDKFVVSINDFSSCSGSGSYKGAQYWVVNKAEMISGLSASISLTTPDNTLFSIHPVQSLSSTATQFMVSVAGSGLVDLFSMTGTPGGTMSTIETALPIHEISSSPHAPQLGTSATLDTGDNRVQDAVWFQGKLWLAFDDGCIPLSDIQVRSCFRVVEIDTQASPPQVLQDFDVGQESQYYFYPALGVDPLGSLIIVFGSSSAQTYPGLLATGQSFADSFGSWQTPVSIINGTSYIQNSDQGCNSSSVCRYGDYFGASVDPSNPYRIWVAGEYITALLFTPWQTHIASVTFAPTESILTLSYSVLNGGSGYSPPLLSYSTDGILQSIPITGFPRNYALLNGTSWTISSSLPGSSSTERWATDQPTSGTAIMVQNITFPYYRQFYSAFDYAIVGGGLSYSAPVALYMGFGKGNSANAGLTVWADAGSSWQLTNPLLGSSAIERWASNAPSGTVSGSARYQTYYYHQFTVTANFSWLGGGNPPSPLLNSTSFGSASSFVLTTFPQSIWSDIGSDWIVANPLLQQSSERWLSSQSTSGVVASSTSLSFEYNHQFLLTITGGSGGSDGEGWYNAGAPMVATSLESYGRSLGVGERVVSYSLDDGLAVSVQPSIIVVTVSGVMDSAHTISFDSITQYQVALDQSAASSLYSITSPTIPGDSYWYDSGTQVTVTLNGVWGRYAGTGNRLVSYSLDQGPETSVSTTEVVIALSLSPIVAPHSIIASVKVQFLLSLSAPQGSVVSITQSPTMDNWYDDQSFVALNLNYVWNNVAGSSRNSLSSYVVDGSSIQFSRVGSGVFSAQPLLMNGPHGVSFGFSTQYYLNLVGGSSVLFSPSSPTFDNWFDSGVSETVTTNNAWGVSDSNSRSDIVSYAIDGQTFNVSRSGSGSFTTPPITFLTSHSLTFVSTTQFLLKNSLEDGSTASITPSQTLDSWYDSGTKVTIVLHYTWDETPSITRANLLSYSIDYTKTSVARAGSGTMALPEVTMTTYHSVMDQSISQFFITANGVSISGSQTSDGWFDNRTSFTVQTHFSHTFTALSNYEVYSTDPGFIILSNQTLSSITWTETQQKDTLSFIAVRSNITIYVPSSLNLTPTSVTDNGVPIRFSHSDSGIIDFEGSSSFNIDFTVYRSPPAPPPSNYLLVGVILAALAIAVGTIFVLTKRRPTKTMGKE